jgi:ADP-heptose:LPS heptosyltransferase
LVGKTTVSDLSALMKRANLFIAHDCGVFHIAVASNVPIVGLFGPTNPEFTGPYPVKPQHIVIKKEAMADIAEEEVVDAALNLLQKFPR